MNKLYVGVSPHLRAPRSTRAVMGDVLIALAPALAASVVLFGPRALLLTAVSAAACVLCEFIWEKLMHLPVTVGDLSAAVTGVLLAFNVPASMPVWQLIVGDVAAIIVVKMLFGGLGRNFMNPALVGRIVLMFSFTGSMTSYPAPFAWRGADAVSSATPLVQTGAWSWANSVHLFLGDHPGVLGETCVIALALGFVYLLVRRVIKPIIPLCYLGSLALFTWLFGGAQPLLSIFMGGAVLGAVFMATDYVTSPFTNWGKVIFGVGCGLITAAIRVFGNYAEGVTFAILLMNILVPYINDWTRTKPLGGAAK